MFRMWVQCVDTSTAQRTVSTIIFFVYQIARIIITSCDIIYLNLVVWIIE